MRIKIIVTKLKTNILLWFIQQQQKNHKKNPKRNYCKNKNTRTTIYNDNLPQYLFQSVNFEKYQFCVEYKT